MEGKIYFIIYVILCISLIYISVDNFEQFKIFPNLKFIAAFSVYVYMFSKIFSQEIKIGKIKYFDSPTTWIFCFAVISWFYSFLIIPDILSTTQLYILTGNLPFINAFYINLLVQKEIGHKINHKKNGVFLIVFNLYIWITYLFFTF